VTFLVQKKVALISHIIDLLGGVAFSILFYVKLLLFDSLLVFDTITISKNNSKLIKVLHFLKEIVA
jgi:hypothetical protein